METAIIAAIAVLAAAGLSLLASWLSNRNSRVQLQMQLAHDATQRDREREMALRRDVYLPAIEAIVRTQASLGLMTDPNTDQIALGHQLSTDQATIAKVQPFPSLHL